MVSKKQLPNKTKDGKSRPYLLLRDIHVSMYSENENKNKFLKKYGMKKIDFYTINSQMFSKVEKEERQCQMPLRKYRPL